MAARLAAFLALSLPASHAQAPAPLWTASLGFNGSLPSVDIISADAVTLFSADGSALYLAETSLPYPDAPTWTVLITSRDAETGARRWSWAPPNPEGRNGFGTFLVLAADGATLFVGNAGSTIGGYLAAINAATGALVWGPTTLNMALGSSSPLYYNALALPATSASGDLCVNIVPMQVACFTAGTGVARFTVAVDDMNAATGLDPSRTHLFTFSNGVFSCYGTATGALLWQQAMSIDAPVKAAVLSTTTLYAVGVNTAKNSASLYAWDILDGSVPAGFPALLPSSVYMSTAYMAVVPSGSLLLIRLIESTGVDAYTLALLDAATGAEQWVFTPTTYVYPIPSSVFSADGSLVFVPGTCVNLANPLPCKGTQLPVVNLATGKLAFSVSFPEATIALPFYADASTGGAVVSSFLYLQGLSLPPSSQTTVGVTPLGATSWVLASAPAPAPKNSYATFSAAFRRVVYVAAPTAGADVTTTLVLAALPAPAAAGRAQIPTAAIAGGVAGAVALVAAGVAIFYRAALAARLGLSGAGEGAALLDGPRTPSYFVAQADAYEPSAGPPRFTRQWKGAGDA